MALVVEGGKRGRDIKQTAMPVYILKLDLIRFFFFTNVNTKDFFNGESNF